MEKKLSEEVIGIRESFSGDCFRLVFQDETRVGLISESRKCWCIKPHSPLCLTTINQASSYVYGIISPTDGRFDSLILPEVNTECMQIFIDEISGRYIGENLIMVLDGASWHKSKRLRLPENIKFLFLPPYSPELNPIEMFWGELKEKFLHNRVFDNIDSLENQLVNGLMYYEANNDITKSVVAWEWIINAICILN